MNTIDNIIGYVVAYKQVSENTTVRVLLTPNTPKGITKVGMPVKIIDGEWIYLGVVTRQMTIDNLSSREDYLSYIAQYGFDGILRNFASSNHVLRFIDVRLISSENRGAVSPVDTAPTTSAIVVIPEEDFVKRHLGFSNGGAFLGYLYNTNYRVTIDLDRLLPTHGLVLGQTGSGKSHFIGVLVEEALERGVPVLIFDYFGEYLTLSIPNASGIQTDVRPKAYNVDRKNPLEIPVELRKIITMPEIVDYLDLSDQMRLAIHMALDKCKDQKIYTIDSLENCINTIRNKFKEQTIDGVRRRLYDLRRLNLKYGATKIEELIKNGSATVVDISMLPNELQGLYISYILDHLVEARKRGTVDPVVVVIEEAHNFLGLNDTPANKKLRHLIRSGRKWGISIWLTSQRPAYLHPDVVNIVNTHVVFRVRGSDLEVVKRLIPLSNEEIEELPMLPTGVAYLATPVFRAPIKIAVRSRRTLHGGTHPKFTKIKTQPLFP